MTTLRDYQTWIAETEFGGGSYNGPALMETLRSLPLEEARSADTYEGYSAWGVALHVLYFKYLVARELGGEVPPYSYEEKDWPSLPAETNADTYEALLSELESMHRALMNAYASTDDEKLAEEMPGWGIPKGSAFAWVAAHDTNHNTQIRNMGLPSLRQR